MVERYAYEGPINRSWRSRPRFEWRDYILAIWRRYNRYRDDDRLLFTGMGDWFMRLNDEGIYELRKIARDLGYGDPRDRSRDSWSGVEHMLSIADHLDVGVRIDHPDPRPMLRRLAGIT